MRLDLTEARVQVSGGRGGIGTGASLGGARGRGNAADPPRPWQGRAIGWQTPVRLNGGVPTGLRLLETRSAASRVFGCHQISNRAS